jgi:hypothetical protein
VLRESVRKEKQQSVAAILSYNLKTKTKDEQTQRSGKRVQEEAK